LGEGKRSDWKAGNLLAVDMESYGLLRAVEWLTEYSSRDGGVPNLLGAIIIRGISDLCEEKAESDLNSFNETRRVAVANATEVATWIIESMNYKVLTEK
jgi:nucleoside phosphorylase